MIFVLLNTVGYTYRVQLINTKEFKLHMQYNEIVSVESNFLTKAIAPV